ncbi:non-structural maintenance of chromosomes element 1 homolog [Orbicella faveolata]|uniref:non-structural maintenance of chromosomes element 1 homolog n=1 Tax=Orbicella faveolata TaxID=48498 RepID=UPI0009E44A7D|nr:non-structural maintenance of chromosomes element 1 homolog [Orbicella faveolata]
MRDSHRLFLRSLMSKQFLSEKETKALYQKACRVFGDDSSPENFETFLETVNRNLKPLYMEIRRGVSEEDGSNNYGLVNTTEDEQSKLATDFSPNDIAFFKKAMDLIVDSPDGTVSSFDVINASADLEKRMNITHAEELIERLLKDKWMSETSGSYSLGPRAMLELYPYLKRVYEDQIVDCMMCREIAIRGQCCTRCDGKIHHHCAARYFRGRAQKTCPNQQCGAVWMHEVPQLSTSSPSQVNGENDAGPSSQAGPPGRQRRKRR